MRVLCWDTQGDEWGVDTQSNATQRRTCTVNDHIRLVYPWPEQKLLVPLIEVTERLAFVVLRGCILALTQGCISRATECVHYTESTTLLRGTKSRLRGVHDIGVVAAGAPR